MKQGGSAARLVDGERLLYTRQMAQRVFVLLLLLTSACSPRERRAPPSADAQVMTKVERDDSPMQRTRQAAPLAASTSSKVEPSLHHGLPWYEDAPDAALALAKQSGKLVLADLWAAWCHTCLSMRNYVLTRERLADVHERLVLLSLDTERADNAAMLQKLPIGAWPTFYLLDGEGQIFGRWVGAASPRQLVTFVRDGLRARDAARAGKVSADDPLTLLLAADRAAADGALARAREHYERALAQAQASWPRRPDALVALASSLRKLGEYGACADLSLRSLASTGDAASATDFSYHAVACANALAPDDRRAARVRTAVSTRLEALCFRGSEQLTPDDRGDACGLLRELEANRGKPERARRATVERLRVLEQAAAGLPDEIALTYDFARVESLLSLGRGDEAISLLEARERALPDDYNPAHYLARALRDLGRHEPGLLAVERSLAKASGPRRAAILGVKVDLLLGVGRKEDARRTLEQQLAAYRALPPGQAQPAREQTVSERLTALTEGP